MEEKIIALLVRFLGDYGKNSGEWYSFNCPSCAEEKGVDADGKYNLEVNPSLDTLAFHCWVCKDTNGMKGPISKLIKRYGGPKILAEYRSLLAEYKSSRMYMLGGARNCDDLAADFHVVEEVQPPVGMKPLRKGDPEAEQALAYVYSRGITDKMIERFNLGYIANDRKAKFIERERVYIPSYDRFDEMTYWQGRDYTGKKDKKTHNPKVSKDDFVFNEGMLNWYQPVTIVEGPFDHMSVPNSIPLLGKTLNPESVVYSAIVNQSKSNVNIMLDSDAKTSALKLYRLLEKTPLKGRVRLIECPDEFDPAKLFEVYGWKGVINVMNTARKLSEYELMDVFKR